MNTMDMLATHGAGREGPGGSWAVLITDVTEFTAVVPSLKALLLFLQEVLLKRAADLVEALYGMPHNNQVGDGA